MNFDWIDNPIVRGISRLVDFVILNLLWLVCSIPVITIGASTTALFSVTLKLVKNEEGYIVKGYLKAFKENWKQSTALWSIFLLADIVLIIDFSALKLMSDNLATFYRVLFGIMACLLFSAMIYAFGLQARFVNTVKNTLKNAVILVFARLPYTALLLVITIAPVTVTFLTAQTLVIGFIVWLFIGFAAVASLQSLVLRCVFDKLKQLVKSEDEETEAAEE